MVRIRQKTSINTINNLAQINDVAAMGNLTYEEAFNIVKDYVQLAYNKPYADIFITYAYLDILGVIEKLEAKIKKSKTS